MNNHLPKIKTIRVMSQEMGKQQQAVFRMAFKMHNMTNYVIVSPDSGEKPDLILIDTNTPAGVEAWKESKKTYSEVPVAMFSSELSTVATPYLAKPVKFDTLSPALYSLAQGGNVFEPSEQQAAEENKGQSNPDDARKATIRRSNPNKGLLGALRFASQGHQDITVLHEGKPILIASPSIQRVLLTVSASELEKLCKNDDLTVVCKAVPDNPQWKERAKVTIMLCLWQMAIWTASGRLIYPMTLQTIFTLKCWPNLTRLAHIPESMRLSAFLTKTPINLNVLYKIMPLEMPDILDYLSATYMTGFLATGTEFATDTNNTPSLNEQIGVNGKDVPETAMGKEAQKVAGPSKEQPHDLLQRLMRKLLGKS